MGDTLRTSKLLELARCEIIVLTAELAEARAEIEQYKGCLQLLSSIWYHGDFVVETYNEARLCELMKLLGFWPYKEEFKQEG